MVGAPRRERPWQALKAVHVSERHDMSAPEGS
jgi:hypothetical protein